MVEEAEHERPEGGAVGDLHAPARPSRPCRRSSTASAPDVADRPARLVGVDQQPGGDGLASSPISHGGGGGAAARWRASNAAAGSPVAVDVRLDAVEAERALVAGAVVEAGQVPVAVAERQPVAGRRCRGRPR